MTEVKKRLQIFIILFIGAVCAGTFGFMNIEKISFLDSLYFNIVTMSTVGYGDIHPTHQLSRFLAIFIIIFGGGAFIGFIANATELMFLRRDAEQRMKKQNIVLGIFFSELGNKLLKRFSECDVSRAHFEDLEKLDMNVSTRQLSSLVKKTGPEVRELDTQKIDLCALNDFLCDKHYFILNLLENPVAVEHEGFTELLLSVAHLSEELKSRESLSRLSDTDRQHLTGDMSRAYGFLIQEWIIYLIHLKENYAYLYSLAVRKNPFNPEASIEIKT